MSGGDDMEVILTAQGSFSPDVLPQEVLGMRLEDMIGSQEWKMRLRGQA